jgi:hypothetical protein
MFAPTSGANMGRMKTHVLVFQNALDLADFVLNFAGDFFDLTFVFEVGLVRRSANLFFDLALYFVKFALCFVFCTLSHDLSPWVGVNAMRRENIKPAR